MLVGLFDQDLLLDKRSFLPSLELMQYAQYYKTNGHVVKLFCNANEYTAYDKIFIRKDTTPLKHLSSILLNNPKSELLGKAFYGNNLLLPPKEVVNMPADISIYSEYLQQHFDDYKADNKKLFKKFLTNSTPLRLTHKGELLYKELPPISTENILLYDLDIFLCKNILDILETYNDYKIQLLNNQWISDWELFEFIAKNKKIKIRRDHTIAYEGNKKCTELLKHFDLITSKYTISFRQRAKNEDVESWVVRELLDKGNLYFYFLSRNKRLELSNRTKSGTNYSLVLARFAMFTKVNGLESSKKFMDCVSGETEKQALVLQNKYPSLYPIFNSVINKISKGGYWRI